MKSLTQTAVVMACWWVLGVSIAYAFMTVILGFPEIRALVYAGIGGIAGLTGIVTKLVRNHRMKQPGREPTDSRRHKFADLATGVLVLCFGSFVLIQSSTGLGILIVLGGCALIVLGLRSATNDQG